MDEKLLQAALTMLNAQVPKIVQYHIEHGNAYTEWVGEIRSHGQGCDFKATLSPSSVFQFNVVPRGAASHHDDTNNE